MLESYRSDLFVLFPLASVAVSAVSFLLFALPLTALATADPQWLRRYRIQRHKPRSQDLVWPSLRCWLVNNAAMLAVVLAVWPVLQFSAVHAGPLPSWYVILGQLVFFIYVDDFLYYWVHRAMHTQWLYKRIHGWHHRILTPVAVTGHYMHPFEYVLTGGLALVGPLLLGSHVAVLWLWFAFRQWEAAEGHCGYDLPWTPTHFLPGHDGAVHHDVHHERVRGNYAGFLPIWDGRLATFARGYGEELRRRRARKAGVTS
ncbi:MAG TPA: sterol desaturase family protein [Terriglobales bacterium]|nr:sterol desaturase family protein [Terriglobales bacterium]